MNRTNQAKAVTKEELGLMLHKYINPLYKNMEVFKHDLKDIKGDVKILKDDVNVLKGDVKNLKVDVNVLKGDVQILKVDVKVLKGDVKNIKDDLEDVKGIQLRMENKSMDDRKILYDQSDAHDKKLKNHEKRISSLEKPF